MGPILNGYGVMGVFKMSEMPFGEPCIASRTTQSWTGWYSQQKLQLTTHTDHNQAEAWVAARCGIFEYLLEAQVSVKWRWFHEFKLNLYFKFIRYYVCLLLYSIYFQQSSLFSVSSGHNSITVPIGQMFMWTFLITKI